MQLEQIIGELELAPQKDQDSQTRYTVDGTSIVKGIPEQELSGIPSFTTLDWSVSPSHRQISSKALRDGGISLQIKKSLPYGLLNSCKQRANTHRQRHCQSWIKVGVEEVAGVGYSFPHLALAALDADLLRCSGVNRSARRFPPIRPPLRPISAMTREMALLGIGSSSSGSVDSRTS